MNLIELGYVVVDATNIEAWRRFGADVLGLMPVDGPDGVLYLKMDERPARFVVRPADTDGFAAAAWGTRTEEDFTHARDELIAAGMKVTDATSDDLRVRQVQRMFRFLDPAGNRHEVFCGPVVDPIRFVSPAGVRRFVSGELGMGHVVLPTGSAFEETVRFFTSVVGLGPANSREFRSPDRDPVRVQFLQCNDRQHSLALGEVVAPSGCSHIALEVGSLDDVGDALDRAVRHGVLARQLGKHINDAMVSFYVTTPGGFQLEYGFSDGEPTWPRNSYFVDAVGSYWGHAWVGDSRPVGIPARSADAVITS